MNKILIIIFIFNILTACQSVKDGLTGKKQNNSDEFLIKKKNPLILPPDYGKLPKPGDQETKNEEADLNELEILLKKDQNLDNDINTNTNGQTPIEKLILDKIKNK